MLRRLHQIQPASFAFTPANEAWAAAQVTKYPEGRQASAIIPLLWRAQEQEGWLSRPAIEHVADRLGMPYIRALEVATFYFMFQLSPVGSVAHVQVCGTLSCMLRGSEDLMDLCKSRISPHPHHPSADGRLSWEEVECLGACANAPMAQIGKDYYEDLDVESLGRILDGIEAGDVPRPGSQIGRFASEPAGGLTSLHVAEGGAVEAANGSVALALLYGDTLKRIDGTEQPWSTPWIEQPEPSEEQGEGLDASEGDREPTPGAGRTVSPDGITVQEAQADSAGRPEGASNPGEGQEATGAPASRGPGPSSAWGGLRLSQTADPSRDSAIAALRAMSTPRPSAPVERPAPVEPPAPEQVTPADEAGRRSDDIAALRGSGGAPVPSLDTSPPMDMRAAAAALGIEDADDLDNPDAWDVGVRRDRRGGDRDGLSGTGRPVAPAFDDDADPSPARARRGARRDDPRDRLAPANEAEIAVRLAQLETIAALEPLRIDGPRRGTGDDLERIGGVGPKINGILHGLGIWHFDQIAAWTPGEVAWVDGHLTGFHGRIIRDRWVEQARLLADEAAPEPAAPEPKPEIRVYHEPAPIPRAVYGAVEAAPGSTLSRLDPVSDEEMEARYSALVTARRVEPERLASARDRRGDDLERISGVGRKLNELLHDLGIWHFDQIAAWGPGEVAWVNDHLASFSGRIVRERWVEQARLLMSDPE